MLHSNKNVGPPYCRAEMYIVFPLPFYFLSLPQNDCLKLIRVWTVPLAPQPKTPFCVFSLKWPLSTGHNSFNSLHNNGNIYCCASSYA